MASDDEETIERHLDWSNKQGRILTAGGLALNLYTEERGFPFRENELPHHHLQAGTTHGAFAEWAGTGRGGGGGGGSSRDSVCGAWTRSIFFGGFEYSSAHDEQTFNVQTNTLFVDIRIPTLRQKKLANLRSFAALDDIGLRLYARQHAFGGYTVMDYEGPGNGRPVCTRHHCIDWNFVGVPRPRPNKWWVEFKPSTRDSWKEWAYATDDFGQHYYCEQWDRLDGDSSGSGVVVALRKAAGAGACDGILVVVGVSTTDLIRSCNLAYVDIHGS
jgi:hypothetical protein